MFNLAELSVIAIVALLVIGPKQLPTVAFQLGKLLKSMQRLLQPLQQEWRKQTDLAYNQARAKEAEANQKNHDR